MKEEKSHILWFVSWFPNKFDSYAGDFIERHAQAAALKNDIYVLHVLKAKENFFTGRQQVEPKIVRDGLESNTIYYRNRSTKIRWLHILLSNISYLRCHLSFFKKHIKEHGRPECIHVHIALKAGLAALMIHWLYGMPYLISEHWGGLSPGARPGFREKSYLFRYCWKLVMKKAKGYSAVSLFLAKNMEQLFSVDQVAIIPNVVNSSIFYPSGRKPTTGQFIHISTLNYPKNPTQMLEAFRLLKNRLDDFKVLIFGEPDNTLRELADTIGISQQVEFKGTCDQRELCRHMQESIALILYSRHETFGCVVIEANACGKPVIVSDIPVFHENVRDGLTGVFVPLDNPVLLAEAMYSMATGNLSFNENEIVAFAHNNYSYEKIGNQFNDFYLKSL